MEVRGGWGKEERGGERFCFGNSGRIVRVPTENNLCNSI